MLGHLIIAALVQSDARADATGRWAVLLLVVLLLSIVVLSMLVLVLLARRRRMTHSPPARKTVQTPDPWEEAGRRARPIEVDDE